MKTIKETIEQLLSNPHTRDATLGTLAELVKENCPSRVGLDEVACANTCEASRCWRTAIQKEAGVYGK